LKNKKILLIDNDASALESMSTYLAELGYEVFKARNCITGLEIVKNLKPDAVVSDIRMSGLNGLEFAIVMKGLNYGIPVILVSSCDMKSNPVINKCTFGYLQKPLDIVELKKMIGRAVTDGNKKYNRLVNC
jgi:DNA-binding NtrC family response regulator